MPSPLIDESTVLAVRDWAYKSAKHITTPDRAEDIAQEIALKLLEGRITLPADQNAWKAWTYQVSKHLVLDAFRAQQRHPELPDVLWAQLAASCPTGEGALTPDTAVRLTLASLPAQQSHIFRLYLQGHGAQAIACIEKLSPATVYRCIANAKAQVCLQLMFRGGRC